MGKLDSIVLKGVSQTQTGLIDKVWLIMRQWKMFFLTSIPLEGQRFVKKCFVLFWEICFTLEQKQQHIYLPKLLWAHSFIHSIDSNMYWAFIMHQAQPLSHCEVSVHTNKGNALYSWRAYVCHRKKSETVIDCKMQAIHLHIFIFLC